MVDEYGCRRPPWGPSGLLGGAADRRVRLRRHHKLFRAVQQAVPKSGQKLGRRLLGRRLDEPYRLSVGARRQILDVLAEDIQRLHSEYGVDTSGWTPDAD